MMKKKSCQGISLVEQPGVSIKSIQGDDNRNSFKYQCGGKQVILDYCFVFHAVIFLDQVFGPALEIGYSTVELK
jgi:hypothetical protein